MFGDLSTINTYNQNPNYRSSTAMSGSGGGSGLGWNMDTLQFGLSGLNALGSFWNSFQAQKLAKQQFAFTKDITETNLANSIKSYNTSLSDRARSRGVVEGQSDADVAAYIAANQLTR